MKKIPTQTVSQAMAAKWPSLSPKITTINPFEAPANPLSIPNHQIHIINLKNHINNHLTAIQKTKVLTKTHKNCKSRNMIRQLLSCAGKDVEESLIQTVFANIKKSAKKSSKTKGLNSTSNNKESLQINRKSSWNKVKLSKKKSNKKRKWIRKNNKISQNGRLNHLDSEQFLKPIVEEGRWPSKKRNS
jgi:hypothetical protein